MPAFDLRRAFLAKQDALFANLKITAAFTTHGTTIGSATEADWTTMITGFLPRRYGVGPVSVIDSRGSQSHQIDLAIYDQQYAPLWFSSPAGERFIPVESVYAAFEIKPEINKQYLVYAGKKIASIRSLHRTSAQIYHLGGIQQPQDPASKPILGGILGLRGGWASGLSGSYGRNAISVLTGDERIDLGIALDDLAFDVQPTTGEILFSQPGTQLIYFAMHLFKHLQRLGTALAADLDEYEKALSEGLDTARSEQKSHRPPARSEEK